jgi:3-hydroxybutyryl-CoA dehydrogenase
MSGKNFGIERIGVVGSGLMGTGIAEVTAVAGFPTVLCKATAGPPAAARERIERSLARRVERGKLEASAAEQAMSLLTVTGDQDALEASDLVIESIIEDRDVKRALFEELAGILQPAALLASNTSTLRIGDLAPAARRQRTIGLHFFSPVPAMSLVELAHLPETDVDAVEAAQRFVERLGKTAIPVMDSTGFVVNRLLVPYLVGAIAAYGQGLATASQIDTAMRLGCGHPMGPLALADLIGLDVVFAMAKLLYKDFGDSRYRPPALLRRMVADGCLGKKTRLGIYDYRTAPPEPNQAIWELIRGGQTREEHAA